MKKYIFGFFTLLICFTANAQDSAYQAGQVVFSIGAGYPNIDKYNFNNISTGGAGPFHLKMGIGLTRRIEMVASVNYSNVKDQLTYMLPDYTTRSYNIRVHYLSALLRFNYHFSVTKKIDPYFGAGIGYRQAKVGYNDKDFQDLSQNTPYPLYYYYYAPGDIIPVALEASVGMRYYFNQKLGFYTELGITKSAIQLGLVYKL